MIRFYNGKTLRFGGGMRITEDEVWTDGGSIVHVGPASEALLPLPAVSSGKFAP